MREVLKFNIVNNSSITISTRLNTDEGSLYPDTTITQGLIDRMPILESGQTLSLGGFSPPENIFNNSPADTLSIYFFETEILNNNSFENIRDNYRVLKRYDLSVEDLELLNFEIPYPPTPIMSLIKQFPPYE
jgi:hypothetical protein